MAHVISFKTAKFDVSAEKPNPINPIAGQGVLAWLRRQLAEAQYRCTEPDTEDWGWYIDVIGAEASYLVGASGEPDDTSPEIEWILQVHKSRSLKEKLLGRNAMTPDDPLTAQIERILRTEGSIAEIVVDRKA